MDLKINNLINRLKLAKALLKFGYLKTDKGVLTYEGELQEGLEVFLEEGEDLVTAPNGVYVADDVTVEVSEGKIVKVETKEIVEEIIEEQKEEMAEEEVKEEVVIEEPQPDEKDARIAELEAKVDELGKVIEEKDAKIAELEAALQATDQVPVEEEIKIEGFSKEEQRLDNLSKALKRK